MDLPSINQIVSPQEQHCLQRMTIIAISVAVIFGLLYWWSTGVTKQAPVTQNISESARIAAILNSSPVQVTDQERSAVAAQLQSSNVTVSDTDRQAIIQTLQAK